MKHAAVWMILVAGCSSSGKAVAPVTAAAGPAEPVTPPEANASTCHPESNFGGAALSAPEGSWTWIDFPEARCRDGSATGIGVRLHRGSDKLALYFEGGGACFHGASCAINDVLQRFDGTAFAAWTSAAGSSGIFDDARADNPLHGWNLIYVPYCTGDVHAGSAEHVDVPGGPTNQSFVGYRNVGHYLQRLVPSFPDVSQVVVTGISAGGFGAAMNYDRVAQAFCHARVTLVDDSGPPMGDAWLAPCLQQRWRQLWNLDATLPADCAACRGSDGGGIVNYVGYLAKKYPDAQLGLISANQDSIISLFFGYGTNHCAGLSGASAGMSGATFEAGLADLRAHYFNDVGLGSYIVPSTSHTWETGLTFYSTTVAGMALPEWMNQIVNLHFAMHVDP
jgi:pectinacetylesterase